MAENLANQRVAKFDNMDFDAFTNPELGPAQNSFG